MSAACFKVEMRRCCTFSRLMISEHFAICKYCAFMASDCFDLLLINYESFYFMVLLL